MDAELVVRQLYDALAAGDSAAVQEVLADDVEWIEAAGFPYGGTYRGARAVLDGVFGAIAADWVDFAARPETFVATNDRQLGTVAVLGWYSGTNKVTGRSLQARFTHWYTVDETRIRRFEQVVDSAVVAAAAQH